MTGPDDHDALRDEVARLRREHEAQATRLRELEAKLALTIAELPGASGPAGSLPSAEPPGAVGGSDDDRHDRRALLRRAGALAAAGVVGGAALSLSDAGPAAAAAGVFDGDPAVDATATTPFGTAVLGRSTGHGIGVVGASSTGYGVIGSSDTIVGVKGYTRGTVEGAGVVGTAAGTSGAMHGVYGTTASPGGHGVHAEGPGVAIYAKGDAAALQLAPTAAGPASGTHVAGELLLSPTGNTFWACVADGTPGTWRTLAGSDTAGSLHVLPTPVRAYDSRAGFAPATGPKSPLARGVARTVDLTLNATGVPIGATGVLVNLIVADTADTGFLAIYANGIAWPGTSNLVWTGAGIQQSVTTLAAVDATARVALYSSVATNVVIDVVGYYV